MNLDFNKPYSTNNLLLPYCIYHLENESLPDKEGIGNPSIHLSHISSPELIVDSGGTNPRYKCMDKSLLYSEWKPYNIFYGINPLYKPIPKDMILISSHWKLGEPYNTIEISHVLDPYKIDNDIINFTGGVYFYAYNRKVNGTIPLYFFKNNDGIYATFNKDPPKNVKEKWIKPKIPVVYVISPDWMSNLNSPTKDIGLNDIINDIKFDIKDYTCIPDKNGKLNLSECLLNSIDYKDTSLLDKIKIETKSNRFNNFIYTIPIYFIIISVCIIIIYFYYKYI